MRIDDGVKPVEQKRGCGRPVRNTDGPYIHSYYRIETADELAPYLQCMVDAGSSVLSIENKHRLTANSFYQRITYALKYIRDNKEMYSRIWVAAKRARIERIPIGVRIVLKSFHAPVNLDETGRDLTTAETEDIVYAEAEQWVKDDKPGAFMKVMNPVPQSLMDRLWILVSAHEHLDVFPKPGGIIGNNIVICRKAGK